MTKTKMYPTMLLILFLLCGCAGVDFKKAKQLNTVEGYETFLAKYPNSSYTKEANVLREKVFFENVCKTNTITSYDSFLNVYSNGKYSFKVKEKKIELLFQQARHKNSIKGYEEFIIKMNTKGFIANSYNSKKHSIENCKSKFIKEARKYHELLLWKDVNDSNSINKYDRYLYLYPKGKYKNDAQQKIEELYWKSIKNENSFSSYKKYLNKYPNGIYSFEAKKNHEFLLWKSINNSIKINELESYTVEYPHGKYIIEAQQKIEDLYWNLTRKKNTISAYTNYIKKYPEGNHLLEAKKIHENMLWNSAMTENTYSSYNEYIREYPKGKYHLKAQKSREEAKKIEEKEKAKKRFDVIIGSDVKYFLSLFKNVSKIKEDECVVQYESSDYPTIWYYFVKLNNEKILLNTISIYYKDIYKDDIYDYVNGLAQRVNSEYGTSLNLKHSYHYGVSAYNSDSMIQSKNIRINLRSSIKSGKGNEYGNITLTFFGLNYNSSDCYNEISNKKAMEKAKHFRIK